MRKLLLILPLVPMICFGQSNNTITACDSYTWNDSTFTQSTNYYDFLQLGSDIDGEAADDWSGFSISLSADGMILAIGAKDNDGNGSNSGHVRIYSWDGSSWNQLGADIDGEAAGDHNGWSVSLSADGMIVAVGAAENDGNGPDAGHVRIFSWDGSSWNQLGSDIDGEAADDGSGYYVSLSADGMKVAIGASSNDGNGTDAGHVRIYSWDGSSWNQLGADINGEAAYDYSGRAVSLSADGTIIAIGATANDGNGNASFSGHVRIYSWDGSSWNQLGSDIDSEGDNDYNGSSVSLSADGMIVATGASSNDGNGNNSGHVRIYSWDGSSWNQLGSDIDGEATDDYSGKSVSLSSDGTRVAIGAPYNDGNGNNSGHIRIYSWDGSFWNQIGSDIDGEVAEDRCGNSVSLSSDGMRVAVGSFRNDGNGTDAGHVRIYSLESLDLTINNSSVGIDIQEHCDTYTWIDGNTYTSSNNTATHTLTNAAGCDSVVTLDLTINYPNIGTDVITACDSYTWIDGNTYTSSNNTATYTIPNATGCDSVVTLDLTINYSNTGTNVITAVGSYTWVDGNTYTASNNSATYTTTNVLGCDSVITLDLTIVPLPNNAQDRMTLVETFTSSTCGPCNSGNVHLEGLFADPQNDNKYVSLKYQMNWPGNGDPYYTDEGGVRRLFYGIPGIPSSRIDGTEFMTSSITQADLLNAYAIPPLVNITTTYTIDVQSQTIDVFVDVEALVNLDAGLRLYVGVFEYLTTNNIGSNGETQFEHVMKKMLPDAKGSMIPALTVGQHFNYSETYTFNGNYRLPNNANDLIDHTVEHSVEEFSDLGVATWVQSNGTQLEVNSPVGVAGLKDITVADFGGAIPTTPLTESFMIFYDNIGDPYDACEPAVNAAQLNGKIAVIRRGSCEYGCKAEEAQNAGAVAVLIVNNVAGSPVSMGPGTCGANVTIPTIMIGQTEGEALITEIENNTTVIGTLVNKGLDINQAAYGNLSSLSLNEDLIESSVKVYPNPASESVFIALQLSEIKDVKIEFINMLGKIVSSTVKKDVDSGRTIHSIKTSALSDGIYTVCLYAGNSIITKKIVVQN